MDDRRFDELTKALVAEKPSRRDALRRLAGGALAAVFGGVAIEGVSAQRVGIEARTCGQRCDTDAQCNAGLQCGEITGRCFAIPDSRNSCTGNGDCTRNFETCNNNDRCVNTVAPTDCDECSRTGDCEDAGRICSNGRCIIEECRDSGDCGRPDRWRCRNGRCIRRD
jgi:hypothetical protein